MPGLGGMANSPTSHDIGEGRDAQRPEKLLGQGPGGDAGGGFPGAGPFQDRPHRGQVLDRAAQVAMSRPGPVRSSIWSILKSLLGMSRAMGLPRVIPRQTPERTST